MHWKKEEISYLKGLFYDNISNKDIAVKLGRTETSVYLKINKLLKAGLLKKVIHCPDCGVKITNPMANRKRCATCAEKSRLKKVKAYNHNPKRKKYLKDKRNDERFNGLRYKILERDGYKCTKCGVGINEKRLDVHHIDGVGRNSTKPNNNIDNLITLCTSCHTRTHKTKNKELINE